MSAERFLIKYLTRTFGMPAYFKSFLTPSHTTTGSFRDLKIDHKVLSELAVILHICNPSTKKAEAGESCLGWTT